MTPSTAQSIIRNLPQDGLVDYVGYRLEELYKQFETVKSEDLGRLQGRVEEVKLLLRIRQDSQNVLDQARKPKNG